MDRLTIPRPDDWHLHLRDGAMLAGVAPDSNDLGRALVMPNLVPPVVTGAEARAYRDRIRAAGARFEPLMTLYLTEATDPADVRAAYADGSARAVKLYPAGATTNSHAGVRDWQRVAPVLEAMAEIGMPLCLHGEVTDPEVDIFDREAAFVDRVLTPMRAAVPGLRIVMEHVTTADAVAYVRAENLMATITVHHLIINRTSIFQGGLRPHLYCLPVAKRERHRVALVEAATSGDRRFALGTDSAPHADSAKLAACGCAGIYTAPVAVPLTAQVFDEAAALDRLSGFVSEHGAAFHGLPVSSDRLTIERCDPWTPPPVRETGAGPVTIFVPHPITWRVAKETA